MTENNGTILIVDDSPKNIQLLATFLDQQNYDVIAATNGFEALDTLQKHKPDLILLDIMMPGIDGYETCAKLKENKQLSDIPVIFLTAKNETEDLVQGFSQGGVDYVTKPFQESELLSRVATHIELKRHRDELLALNREKKELIHMLCHDLTNPISFIQEVLHMEKDDPNILTDMKDSIRISMDNSLDMIDLVRTMLALQDGKIQIETSNHHLIKLINESRQILQTRLEEKNISLNIQVDPSIEVNVDKASFINSVLNNLLTNAIKFSYRDSHIDLTAGVKDDLVFFSVRDYGIGIPETLLNDLFNLNKTTSRIGTNGESGTGYGMPLVKKFIESYGGQIDIQSPAGDTDSERQGTKVNLTLSVHKNRITHDVTAG
ncbi:MAG: hybrid sensor histidine kinase/response regulator [Spirochaetota bacterium]|nr:hybrid sensor histidine kinase/response regulator [Spirochaetota bacterium]